MKRPFKRYRNGSIRLQNWDYSWPGYYFITICTHNRYHYFGEIENGQMILSQIGKIAKKYWLEIPNHFSNIELDAFIIMPDHIHGIIKIRTRKALYVQGNALRQPCTNRHREKSMAKPRKTNNISNYRILQIHLHQNDKPRNSTQQQTQICMAATILRTYHPQSNSTK